MFTFEWLVIGYSLVWLAIGVVSPVRRRTRVAVGSAVALAAVLLAASMVPRDVRLWLAHAYLLAGYWLPALAVGATIDPASDPSTRFETWLVRADRAMRPWLPSIPSNVAVVTELAYLFCYPLIPISFIVVWMRGTAGEADRFWVTVLSAGFACYASLPWLLSRPPRIVDASTVESHGVPGLNSLVLKNLSHRWNTFPSGHVAVSCAAAWSVARTWPEAGAAIGILAGAVAVGAAAGRYHYVLDVVLGFLIAAVAATATAFPAG